MSNISKIFENLEKETLSGLTMNKAIKLINDLCLDDLKKESVIKRVRRLISDSCLYNKNAKNLLLAWDESSAEEIDGHISDQVLTEINLISYSNYSKSDPSMIDFIFDYGNVEKALKLLQPAKDFHPYIKVAVREEGAKALEDIFS